MPGMCWFCIIYAMQFGKEETNEWLLDFVVGFNTGSFIVEPAEVALLAAMPFLFENSCVANCRQNAKDLGLL